MRLRLRALATLLTTLLTALLLTVGTTVGPAQADSRPAPGPTLHSVKHTKKPTKRPPHYRAWKRLAHCESTSRWHVNTGNGYYGGLQISAGTWRAFGGLRYARLPHRAGKLKQMRVAERILRGQGWGAWPHCSRAVGLR